jgi:hypothetical protein
MIDALALTAMLTAARIGIMMFWVNENMRDDQSESLLGTPIPANILDPANNMHAHREADAGRR